MSGHPWRNPVSDHAREFARSYCDVADAEPFADHEHRLDVTAQMFQDAMDEAVLRATEQCRR